MHLTFCELILKDSVGKGATQCTFDELINKRPGSIIRDVRVIGSAVSEIGQFCPKFHPNFGLFPKHLEQIGQFLHNAIYYIAQGQ